MKISCGLWGFCTLGVLVNFALRAQTQRTTDSRALVQKIQAELAAPLPAENKPNASTLHGEFLHGTIQNSKIYPGTENDFEVYVPAQYDPAEPACLLLKLDGMGTYEASVLNTLLANKEAPLIIGVGLHPGTIWKEPGAPEKRQALRYDRSYEFDSVNDHFPDFVLNELLPAVQKLKTRDGRPVRLSPDGNAHAVTGASTGGIGSFTLAWRRPDQFSRVYSVIGTFVSMRGGHEYPALIRKTEPKPIRIFLEDGSTDAWNLLFGSWYEENLLMESALTFAGYDVAHAWGNHGHDGYPGQVILPDVMRWLWRDFPQRIQAGESQNSTLREINIPGETWHAVSRQFESAGGLAANRNGDVYLSDGADGTIYRLGKDDEPLTFLKRTGMTGLAFGPDAMLYGIIAAEKKIVKFDEQGKSHAVANGIAGRGLVVKHDGTLYVSEPGEHSDMPSRIWQITAGSQKKLVDTGIQDASGIAFSPDGDLFFAAEKSGKWVYSFVTGPDGALTDKQAFYWLHMTDIPNNSGAESLAVDAHGNLYVATRMGIQVCDANGRVRAILPLPTPSGPVRALCFGGPHFDRLFATDGKQVFVRRLKVRGVAPWAAPVTFASQGPG